jgi:hypothetical protein
LARPRYRAARQSPAIGKSAACMAMTRTRPGLFARVFNPTRSVDPTLSAIREIAAIRQTFRADRVQLACRLSGRSAKQNQGGGRMRLGRAAGRISGNAALLDEFRRRGGRRQRSRIAPCRSQDPGSSRELHRVGKYCRAAGNGVAR